MLSVSPELDVERVDPVTEMIAEAHIETIPSDEEISRRVLDIRNQWTIAERIVRRHEAEQRLEDLLDKLSLAEAA